MKTTGTTFILLILIFCSFTASAQDSLKSGEKTKEYVFSLRNFAPLNIAIKYKRQLKNRMFFKIALINLSASSARYLPAATSTPTSSFTISAGLGFGLEFRRMITDEFTFFHGPGLNASFSTSILKIDDPTLPPEKRRGILRTNTTGADYTVGLLFHLKKHFYFSAELSPGLTYTNRKDDKDNETRDFNFSLYNTGGLISLVYRL